MGDTRSSDYSFPVISRAVRPDNDLNIQIINSENPLLKIGSLNVCGLAAKCVLPEFIEFVNSFDILAIQESKTDDTDDIQIPGYHVFYHNRAKLARRRSGGIALMVKSEISEYVKVDSHKNSKIVLWFTLCRTILQSDNDINFGVVYIPPVNSKYASDDPYSELQREVLRYCPNSNQIILLGDFNSRSGEKPDYVFIDELISEHCGLDELVDENNAIVNSFSINNLPLHRVNADKVVNSYGTQMIEFCKATSLFILNGRFGDNVQNSKFICKDRSNIDYCVSSLHALNVIHNFEISDFNNLFSDVHSALLLDIKTDLKVKGNSSPSNSQGAISESIKLWDTDKSEQFEQNFDPIIVREIDQKLNILQNKTIDEIKSFDIDSIVQGIGNLFQSTAEVTFGHTKPHQTKNTSTGKPWFNRECRRARNLFHYARRLYHNQKSNHTKLFLKNVSKAYKDTVKRSINLTRSTRVEKLRKLKTTNTREYWKILNSENKKSDCKAPLNELHDFFRNVNAQHSHRPESNTHETNTLTVNEEINGPITEKEVTNAIKQLKNNIASGVDNIKNEHLKQTSATMTPIYTKLFNVVFDTAIIPESWTVGVIKPIYKNKGDPKKPENYRPITILSCLGKLFTLIINNRLKTFTENSQVIDSYQAGFRENYSTADNLFIIKSLIDIARSNKTKLFCCFVDFKQAFDSVWRDGLWLKLNTFNINGKCLRVIQSLYSNIKSKVVANNESSAFFPSFSGVRQGENLSPILFALYLNDLHSFLRSKSVNGITLNENSDELLVYLRLLILLYADDTVLFSNSESDFQYSLDVFDTYCKNWKLTVNASKTKIIAFGNIRDRVPEFKISGHTLEVVDEYKYLGIYLSKTGSFVAAKRHISDQANKALYALLKKSKTLGLPSDLQLDLFNKTVKPILLYGAEVWGIGKLDMLERIQLKF